MPNKPNPDKYKFIIKWANKKNTPCYNNYNDAEKAHERHHWLLNNGYHPVWVKFVLTKK